MDLSRVTVVIPAHNRPKHLRRLLDYYARTNVRIIVTDSSDHAFEDVHRYPDIVYRHVAGDTFFRKVYYITGDIETPYVVFCADDDFIVPQGIAAAVEFLDANPGYVTAQGHYLTFEHKGRKVEFSPRYIRNFDKDINANTMVGRMDQFVTPYASLLYSVCRSDLFRNMYYDCYVVEDDDPLFENLYLAEYYYNLYTLLCGRHKTLPVFYAARERIAGSAADTTPKIETLKGTDEYHFFKETLAIKMYRIARIPDAAGVGLIEMAMRDIHKRPPVDPTDRRQKILAMAKKYLPAKLMDYLLFEHYKYKGRAIVKGMDSYPGCNGKPITPELQAIIDAIKTM